MSKIYIVKTLSSFETTFVVAAEDTPDATSILGMIKDGYIPEFNQEFRSEVVTSMIETSKEDYLNMWKITDVDEQEKLAFITNIGTVPPVPEGDDIVVSEVIPLAEEP